MKTNLPSRFWMSATPVVLCALIAFGGSAVAQSNSTPAHSSDGHPLTGPCTAPTDAPSKVSFSMSPGFLPKQRSSQSPRLSSMGRVISRVGSIQSSTVPRSTLVSTRTAGPLLSTRIEGSAPPSAYCLSATC
jgi:hypothetical protein